MGESTSLLRLLSLVPSGKTKPTPRQKHVAFYGLLHFNRTFRGHENLTLKSNRLDGATFSVRLLYRQPYIHARQWTHTIPK